MATSGSCDISLTIDGEYNVYDSVEPLEVGEERKESFSYKWVCTGTSDEITVYADYEDAVAESNEANNYRTETLSSLKVNRKIK